MDALEALGEPNRRRIVELLVTGEQTAGGISAHFPISRAAVSQHLGVLVEAGVLTVRAAGRRRLYSLDPSGLDQISDWLDAQRSRWADALDRLERAMDEGA